MIKNYITLLCLLISSTPAFAQYPTKSYDFKTINTEKVDLDALRDQISKHRERLDSVYQANKTDSLELLLYYVNTNTSNYSALTLSSEYLSTDYGGLQNELITNGFPVLKEGIYTFGYGFTLRRKRFLHEYLINFFIGRESTSSDITVNVSGANLLNYTFGYDVLNLPRFQLYPFVGISQQFTEIEIKKSPPDNAQFDSIFEIGNQAGNVSLRKNLWKVVGGLELDYHLKYSARSRGIILGLRYALTSAFAEGKYKLDKVKQDYEPNVDLRDSYFSVVLKFYNRNQNKPAKK